MAGAGYKLFNTGDVLTAAQVNTYLQEQAVMVFADASARTTALSGVLAEGMITYLKSDDKVYKYTGAAWVEVGGGSSPLTTKGDIYTYSTADARLAVGSNGQYLSADSTQATGLAWVTPAGGSLTMSEIATGTLSGTQLQISSLTSYNDIWFLVNGVNPSSTCSVNFTINNLVGSNLYRTRRIYEIQSNLYPTPYNFNSTSLRVNDALQSGNTDNIFWVHFSNCKSAGLTTFEFGFAYYKSSPNNYVAEWGGGYYNSAAAVSTLEMNFGSSVSGGTYYVIAG